MEKDTIINFPNTSKTLEESNLALEGIFADIDLDILSEEFDVKPILAAIALPEKEFALIQEIIINELEKKINNVQDKMLMIQALNANGMKAEDFIESFEEITTQIEENFAGKISQQKIDFLKRFMGLFIQAISETEGIAKRIIPIPIELCHEKAKIPTYAKAGDAGMDIFAIEDITILPGETVIIPTGLKVAIPLGYELQVRPRSGLSVKTPLRVANTPGTIDSKIRYRI